MLVVLIVVVVNILKEFQRGRMFDVKTRQNTIPPKLSNLFRDILMRVQDNMNDLLLCIQWLRFSERPLKREEYYLPVA